MPIEGLELVSTSLSVLANVSCRSMHCLAAPRRPETSSPGKTKGRTRGSLSFNDEAPRVRFAYPGYAGSGTQQFDVELQRGVGRDDAAGAACAVAKIGGDDQHALAAFLHALHAFVPALDDHAGAER